MTVPSTLSIASSRRLPWLRMARFSLALLLAALPAAAQWTTESPIPTHLGVNGIAAPAGNRLFLASEDDSFDDGGALFESIDGGTSWTQRAVPESLANGLYGVSFLDTQLGWVWGNENYRTTDGGTTWEALPFLGSTYYLEFYTPSFGLASGNFGALVSRDGGFTWEPSPGDMNAFSFAGDLLGIGAGPNGIQRTTDGGLSFIPVHADPTSAVKLLSPTVAVAIADGELLRSIDGGLTWTPVTSALGRTRLFAVSSAIVLAHGRSGTFPDFDDRILRSADAGASWTDIGEPIARDSFAQPLTFAVPAAPVVVASDGAGNLYRSGDDGATWTLVFETPGPRPGFLSTAIPAFADSLTGYFGFGAGYVVRTSDGGASWAQISSGSGSGLNDMDRFADGRLIAVGENGTVLTSTGSAPWLLQPAPTSFHLEAVQVLGPLEVVAVDEEARVLFSLDGGFSWTPAVAAPANLDARDLHFANLLDGWVAGSGFSNGAVFHTTDGGASWTPVPDFAGSYVAIDFAGTNGWAANAGGRYYRSTDGGASWIEGDLPGSSLQIRDMDFFDEEIGYAVGWLGYAVRSGDGGATWQVLPTPNGSDDLSDIYLLGPDELWLSTYDDVAYYSANGGQNWAILEIGASGFGTFSSIVATAAGDAWTAGFQGVIEHFSGPPPPPLNRPPAASFVYATAGLSIALTDTSSDPDGIVVSWAWEFGDGATSTLQNPTHVYAAADTYHVRLTVTDDDGATGTFLRFIAVQPGPGGVFGDFTEVTPLDPLFVTPQDEDFWVATTAPADYDNDGDLDIAVLGYYVVYNVSVEERLVLLRNDGAAGPEEWEFSYFDVPLGDLTVGASDLAWGDVDGDGDQDLAIGTDGVTAIYRNDAGTLVPTDTELPGYWEDNDQADFDLNSISWADYDNDGDPDLLLPSVWDPDTFSFRTVLMRNDGPNGSGGFLFADVDAAFAPTGHAQTSWADFDGDQDLDLLLVHLAPLTDDGFIRRYRNDGDGVFTGEDVLGTLSIEHGEAQWGDYDDDGDLDILVAGNIRETDGTYTNVLRIYQNDAESWTPFEVIACLPCEGWFDIPAATWADYDSDGDVDILLAGTYNSGSQIEGRARVYDNEGGLFADSGNELPAPRSSGSRGGSFTWLDIDGEGDLDYFIAGEYFVPGGNGLVEAQMHLYLNDAAAENARPTAPSLLESLIYPDGSVDLWWQAASDDLTPAESLTYELRLYRDDQPFAMPRRLPEAGAIGGSGSASGAGTIEWNLTGLADGAYIWFVEAVDSAYNNGPALGRAFRVGDPPPELIFSDRFSTGDFSQWSDVSP